MESSQGKAFVHKKMALSGNDDVDAEWTVAQSLTLRGSYRQALSQMPLVLGTNEKGCKRCLQRVRRKIFPRSKDRALQLENVRIRQQAIGNTRHQNRMSMEGVLRLNDVLPDLLETVAGSEIRKVNKLETALVKCGGPTSPRTPLLYKDHKIITPRQTKAKACRLKKQRNTRSPLCTLR